LKLLCEDSSLKYYIFESASEIDEFEAQNFEFFHIYGITDYKETFKIWLRKFPRPILIAGLKNKEIVAFIYIDPWEELPDIVNVLRAQETIPQMRGKKIGYKMFLLGAFFTPEMIITKPLTQQSKSFYEHIGFKDVREMVRFRGFHSLTGYLALPMAKKREHLMRFEQYFTVVHL